MTERQTTEPLAYQTADLLPLLGVGRHTARRIAAELGVRVGRRILIPRIRLEAWLGGDAMANHPGRDETDAAPGPESGSGVG